MIIKRVVLNNIRSYSNQEIVFPEGKILLTGDIGSGKSSILLAIEFALFGTLRGELSASALLRNGSKKGFVDLEININNKDYLIHRGLKKTKTSIEQEYGYVLIDGIKKEMTPVEIKSFVINLLNYPAEFLTKSKNLIYRFTVYTPQEEMKRILLEDPDTRTGILRKIFNIDKYEKIKSNSGIYTKFLREKQRVFEAVTKDFEEKKKSLEERKNEFKKAEESLISLIPNLKSSEILLKEKEELLKKKEQNVKEINEVLRIYSQNKAVIEQKRKQIEFIKNSLKNIEESLLEVVSKSEDKSKDILKKEEDLKDLEFSLKKFIQDNAGLNALIDESDKLVLKVKNIEKCPMCLQDVKEEHKSMIQNDENKKQIDLKEKEKENSKKIDSIEQNIKSLKENIRVLRELQQEHLIALQKNKTREEKIKQKEIYLETIKSNNKEIDSLESQQIAYKTALDKSSVEEEFKKVKSEFESLRKNCQTLLLEESKLKERISQIQKYITFLERDLNSKIEAKKKLENSKNIHNWFSDYFIPLLDTIEKHVMARIHYEFNDLFQKWFNILVDDDLLYANLDDSFTPSIQQNGYDINYNNLSGGERTACALAYRLSLNKVVNDIFTQIMTKDILILDEPTDGFSEEQLDKIRDVLDELNLKQIIIVSHELKIESFVDHVIRIEKQDHVSEVLT